jgi:polar amino acid transport system substrate-binding protein
MRKYLILFAVFAALLTLVACGDDGDDSAADTTPTTAAADLGLMTPGTVTVASDIPYAPFEFTEPGSSEPKGFDIDLVNAIAENLGITTVKFVDQPFDAIILAIKQGRYDMSASSWTITPERAKEVAFSDPYFSANQAILAQADDTEITDEASLEGKTIAVQRGTVGADVAAKIPNATVRRFQNTDDAFNAVAQGRAAAAITDYPVVAYAAAQKPTLTVTAEIPGDQGLGLMFPQSNPALKDAFNQGLAAIKADGTYDQIYATWFGDTPDTQ